MYMVCIYVYHSGGGGGGLIVCCGFYYFECLVWFQVQWEWQESASTWRPYGRLENKIIEVRGIASERYG